MEILRILLSVLHRCSIKIVIASPETGELAEFRGEKGNGTASELKGIQVPKPIRDINRELKWSFKR